VTEATWNMAVAHGVVDGTLDDATRDDCALVLRVFFWNAVGGDLLPAGVDLMVFNDAMVCGVGHAARLLQRIVGATPDGSVGPKTIAAVCGYGDKKLIDALEAADEAYYASLSKAPQFLRGWVRREKDAQTAAYQLAGIPLDQLPT
jgi:lysozyme family protein